jgi:hypothetical protein
MKLKLALIGIFISLHLFSQIDTIAIPGNTWSMRIRDMLYENGNIWLAYNNSTTPTLSGVRKYDGTTWTDYQTTNSGLPDNRSNCISVDSSGNYWIGTNAGLAKFDGTNWTVYNQSNSGLLGNTVNAVEVYDSVIWVASNGGLNSFNGTSWTSHLALSIFPNRAFNCICKAGNEIYAGDTDGIYRLNGTSIDTFTWRGGAYKIINTPQFGIVFSNPYGAFQFNNGIITPIENVMGLCSGIPVSTAGAALPVYRYIETAPDGGILYRQTTGVFQFAQDSIGFVNFTSTRDLIKRSGDKYFMVIPNPTSRIVMIDPAFFDPDYIRTVDYLDNCYTNTLDVNQVKASALDRNDMFWDMVNSDPKYEVPVGSGSHATFGGSLWIAGKVNNQFRTACQTYRQSGVDFWPGPLDTVTGNNMLSNPGQITDVGLVLSVYRTDINDFIANFNNGNVQSGAYTPSRGILYWQTSDTGNFSRNMAPFVDVNTNGTYDPLTGGDYPLIKGDEMIWSIYNDASNNHTETGANGALGLEIRQSSYAYSCSSVPDSLKAINYTTFYEYELINRSDTLIDSMYVSYWNDVDLGNYNDDYVGCNVTENYAYVYNGDGYDDNSNGVIGYKDVLPFFSTVILKSPLAMLNDGKDNDHNGIVDEPGEQTGMSSFLSYDNSGSPVNGNPTTAANGIQYYRYIKGLWKDGTTMKYGTNGLTGTLSTTYLYPGDTDPVGYGLGGSPANPNPQPAWSEITAGNTPGERRVMLGSGPFRLAPHDTVKVIYALVFTQDSSVVPGDNWGAYARNLQDVKNIRYWYNTNLQGCQDMVGIELKKNTMNELAVRMYPNPANASITLELEEAEASAQITMTDLLGKTILQKQMHSGAESLNLSAYSTGIYFVTVKNERGSKTFKLIKD